MFRSADFSPYFKSGLKSALRTLLCGKSTGHELAARNFAQIDNGKSTHPSTAEVSIAAYKTLHLTFLKLQSNGKVSMFARKKRPRKADISWFRAIAIDNFGYSPKKRQPRNLGNNSRTKNSQPPASGICRWIPTTYLKSCKQDFTWL